MVVCAVQMDVLYGNVSHNVSRISSFLEEAKRKNADLVVFPEAALTGYCASSQGDVREIAIERYSAGIQELRKECDRLDLCALVGFAEREGDSLYNSAAFFEPGVEPRFYRKTHLPFLGMDRFVERGGELPVWDTRLGKIAPLICFDLRFPEATRTLALAGAEILLLPTNWPEGAETSADYIGVTRAAENRIFVVTCNRTGVERGFTFIGRSKIVHPSGRIMASAQAGEEMIFAEIDLAEARQKRTVVRPGEYETEVFAARRPELYTCGE